MYTLLYERKSHIKGGIIMKKAIKFIEINCHVIMMTISIILISIFVAICSYAVGLVFGLGVSIILAIVMDIYTKDTIKEMIENFNEEVED